MSDITEMVQLEKKRFKGDMAIVAKRVSSVQVFKLISCGFIEQN